MRPATVQKTCTARQPLTQQQVHDHGSRYGLALVGDVRSQHREVRRAARLVKDLWDALDQRPVSWSNVVNELAIWQEAEDAFAMEDLGPIHIARRQGYYRISAEWRLMFVLNHLEGSGLAIVRMPS